MLFYCGTSSWKVFLRWHLTHGLKIVSLSSTRRKMLLNSKFVPQSPACLLTYSKGYETTLGFVILTKSFQHWHFYVCFDRLVWFLDTQLGGGTQFYFLLKKSYILREIHVRESTHNTPWNLEPNWSVMIMTLKASHINCHWVLVSIYH